MPASAKQKRAAEAKQKASIKQRIGSGSRHRSKPRTWFWYLKWILAIATAAAAVIVPIMQRKEHAEKMYFEAMREAQKGNFAAAAEVRLVLVSAYTYGSCVAGILLRTSKRRLTQAVPKLACSSTSWGWHLGRAVSRPIFPAWTERQIYPLR